MTKARPFRFATGGGGRATSRSEWIEFVRRVEDLGYSTLAHGQHLIGNSMGPISALSTAAAVTSSLRLLTTVLINDFYNPVPLALEATTMDRLSDGRLEFGIGAGWHRPDFEMAGIPYHPPGVRVSRLTESVRLIKQLFQDEPVTFSGDCYCVNNLNLRPKSVQRPHPPIFIGGGGKRMLSLAAREADIVGLDLRSTTDGTMNLGSMTAEAVKEKVEWVRQAAGERFDELELHILAHNVIVTDDRQRGIQVLTERIANLRPTVVTNPGMSIDQLLESPHVVIGNVEHIVETLYARREQYGISYYTIASNAMEDFAPVVARLAGK